ncbi:helix-turn-helix domain-containing protein [Nonomuraea rubra]|uniref:helix-turn-helix domain-containing protein n=1 Tax=Nonomuraea rubra TaxID=46180 RepID=UPI0033DC6E98
MAHSWRGWCLLRPGLLLYGGTVGRNELHAHHAVQLIVAAEPFTMADARGERVTTRIAVVPPDTAHTVLTGARHALLAHLDPRSSPGRSLLARCAPGPTAPAWSPAGTGPTALAWPLPVPPAGVAVEKPSGGTAGVAVGEPSGRGSPAPVAAGNGRVRPGIRPRMFTEPPAGHARSTEAAAALRVVEEWSGHGGAADVLHPAVEEAIALLPTLLAGGPVRLRAVAEAVHLSPSRLAHLFSAHVGIPLRPYVRWLRLQRAIGRVAAGESLTAAAHAAGFADGPHFTRAFRSTFGNAPSELATAIDWLP